MPVREPMPTGAGMATVAPDEFERFRHALPVATKEGIMATYRISQHSWYKLRDGKPVRQAVIDRIRERHAAIAPTGAAASTNGARAAEGE